MERTGRARQKFPILDLSTRLSNLGAWIRLHYVYPYPHVRELDPLMADRSNGLLPYLDIPFQHAHPDTLKRMARPAAAERTLDEIRAWRRDCPDITLRSTFIVGYPGETEAEFQTLLDWMDEAQLDRVGCFKYENVDGARSNALPDHVPEDTKEDRWHRFMAKAQAISEAKLGQGRAAPAGHRRRGGQGRCDLPHLGRRAGDRRQPVHRRRLRALAPGDLVTVEVDEASDYDLWGRIVPRRQPHHRCNALIARDRQPAWKAIENRLQESGVGAGLRQCWRRRRDPVLRQPAVAAFGPAAAAAAGHDLGPVAMGDAPSSKARWRSAPEACAMPSASQ
jgi:tRNA A37 methylthiotransferase MiaB